ncbi:MAG TPA: hypothetical protein VFB84_01250 [Micromonosporaceae bacterium]|nr:hypothetical protein [Micromonosporaceae bacterium]
MATDQELAAESGAQASGTASGRRRAGRAGRAWTVCGTTAAVLLIGWFFVAWLALDRHVVDAAGESVGSGFALLLLVSVVGAARGGR